MKKWLFLCVLGLLLAGTVQGYNYLSGHSNYFNLENTNALHYGINFTANTNTNVTYAYFFLYDTALRCNRMLLFDENHDLLRNKTIIDTGSGQGLNHLGYSQLDIQLNATQTYYLVVHNDTGTCRHKYSAAAPKLLPNRTITWNKGVVADATTFTNLNAEIWDLWSLQTNFSDYLDNCSTYPNQLVNYSIRNYTDDALLNGTFGGQFSLTIPEWGYSDTEILQYSTSNRFYGVCSAFSEATYDLTTSTEYTYNTASYLHYFNNATVTNATTYQSLYVVDSTSLVLFYVYDENDDPVTGAYIKVRQHDIATNTDTQTEVVVTDDNGAAVAHITLNTETYTFVVEYDGQTVLSTQPTIITSSPRSFRVILGTDYFSEYGSVLDITGDVTWNNVTKVFEYDFNDVSGATRTHCLEVVQSTSYGTTTLNTSCASSSSGTITLNYSYVTAWTGTYTGTGKVSINSNWYVVDVVSATFDYVYKSWGMDGLFLSFLVLVFIVMVGVTTRSPAATVVFATIGVVGLTLMKVFSVDKVTITSIVVVAGFTMYLVSRRNQ